MSMFSATLAPLKQHRVEAGLALERVVVVAGVPDERVVAGAQERDVVAVAAVDQVVPSLPSSTSSPRPPFIVSWMPSASSDVASTVSSPPSPLSVSRSLACSWKKMLTAAWSPDTLTPPASPAAPNDVVRLGAVDGDRVGRAVAAAVGPAQVEADLRQVGAAQVADDDVVGAAQGPEVDALDVVEVHRHVGDVAEEQHPPAVRDDVDVLADVGAEEQHRVGAVLALERVVAVARVPLEHVVAGAHERRRRCRCRRR